MKTSTFKTVLVMLASLLFVAHLFGQELPGTRIDVKGSRYSDQVWIFQNPICTRGFDNGWDALDPDRDNENSLAPEILAVEASDNYHIDVVPDFNETYIGFKAGEDSIYTLTFTCQNICKVNQHLYLVDSVAFKTIDVCASGIVYTFTAHNNSHLCKRFKLITNLSYTTIPLVSVIPPVAPIVPTDTIDTSIAPAAPTDTVAAPEVTDTIPVDTVSAPQSAPTAPSFIASDSHDMKVRVYSVNRTVYVNNTDKASGALSFYNAQTGKVVKNFRYAAQTTTSIQFDGPAGIYIMSGATRKGQISGKLLIQ